MVGQIEPVDVLYDEQPDRVAHDEWRHDEAHATLGGNHPDNTGRQQIHERQPAVVRDAPNLQRQHNRWISEVPLVSRDLERNRPQLFLDALPLF